ncbi:MAG: UPF0182 family protein [Jatrophihabitantaceae bacterium]
MRPPMPSVTLSRRSKIALSVVAALIVLLIVLVKLTGVYVNWLWFGQLGYRHVYSNVLWTRVSLFAIFGFAMALILGGNLVVAYMLRPPFRPMSTEQQNLERYRVMIEPRRKLILAVVMVLSLLFCGMSSQGDWKTWQLWLHGGTFGVKDPQFHRDLSFFTWDYPAYRLMLSFGFTAIIFSVILSVAVHYLSGAIRLQTPGPKVTPAARRHLTVLVFVFMALKAVAYWLDRYGLVFSDRSKFTGASYTDVHSVLPARTILFWIAIILALAVLGSLWLRSALLPGIGFIVLMVLSVLIGGIYPAIFEQVSVKPNASTKEIPYILKNINATRQAYGIVSSTDPGGTVTYKSYVPTSQPSTSALKSSDPTVSDIRILDPNVISPTVTQQQSGKNVYGFATKLDVDRYTIDGVEHDYIVGIRELDAANLQGTQGNWINQHTNYTHGYGFVAAQANKDVTTIGNQAGAYTEGGIPQTGPLTIKHPQTYYGELLPDYSIVGAEGPPQEFDGNGTTKTRYTGAGGVSLSNLFSRLAFAVKYKQGNFVLNDAASATGAKIIFNRDPREMVKKVAPYLTVDSDPYPIVDQSSGDIVWMVDGYTTLNNYPYSERQSLSSLTQDSLSANNKTASQPNDSINYIRNSVKATVDAYTGKVTLYQWDNQDPVLKAWMSIFPGTVQPKADMPTDVLDHARYPEDLFEVQRATLAQYHVDNPVTFYNQSDKWTVPADPTDRAANQPPYYVLASAPDSGATAPEFQLTTPMKVNNQTYLASYISVNNDPGPDYGKFTVLTLPQGSVIQGPEQVFNNFNVEPTISKDINLLGSGGSTIVHGNLLTLPVGDSFLYVEPLYVQGATNGFPILQRILVSYGDKIGYAKTLSEALKNLSQAQVGESLTTTGSPTSPSTPAPSKTPTTTPSKTPTNSHPPTPPTTQQQLLTKLDTAYTDLLAATKSGDFAKIGAAQAQVNELVAQYLERYGQLPSSTGSPSAGTSPSPTR